MILFKDIFETFWNFLNAFFNLKFFLKIVSKLFKHPFKTCLKLFKDYFETLLKIFWNFSNTFKTFFKFINF